MRCFTVLVAAMALVSCSRKTVTVAEAVHTNTSDSVSVVETVRLDSITLPADSAVLDIPLIPFSTRCDTGLPAAPSPAPFKAIATGKKANIEVSIEGGRLKAKCLCNEEHALIAAKDKEIKNLKASTKTEVKTTVEVKEKRYIPVIGWVLIVAAALFWVYKLGRLIASAYTFKPF
jgi:hypothetical protein